MNAMNEPLTYYAGLAGKADAARSRPSVQLRRGFPRNSRPPHLPRHGSPTNWPGRPLFIKQKQPTRCRLRPYKGVASTRA